MTATGIERIPTTWDDERDSAFFRLVAGVFAPEFTYGAGVLLASYDVEFDTAAAAQPPALHRQGTEERGPNHHEGSRLPGHKAANRNPSDREKSGDR